MHKFNNIVWVFILINTSLYLHRSIDFNLSHTHCPVSKILIYKETKFSEIFRNIDFQKFSEILIYKETNFSGKKRDKNIQKKETKWTRNRKERNQKDKYIQKKERNQGGKNIKNNYKETKRGQEYSKETKRGQARISKRKKPRQKLADTVSCPTALVAIVTFLPPFCCSDMFLTISKKTQFWKIHFGKKKLCKFTFEKYTFGKYTLKNTL